MADFRATARIDEGVGAVLNALASAALAESTLVVSTTAHGIAFPAMKCNLTVHGTSVYPIMRGLGGLEGGKVCEAVVSQMDLYPAVCDLLNIEKPGWLEGMSLCR
jgi:arylsulfatase A-like enzyme